VLVAGVRSQRGSSFRLLDLVGDPRWQLNLSPALLFEYEAVMRREATRLWLEPERVEDLLDFLWAQARKPRIAYAWRPCLPDPDDDMILELAVAARANFIITHNVADFKGAERFGIGILSPRDFLKRLADES
jgi:predicted nucleic acid-binding protein